jgi:hypothetical protein
MAPASRRWNRPAARQLAFAGFVALIAAGAVALPRSARPRFYPDDPLWTDDDRVMDASKTGSIEDSTATTSSSTRWDIQGNGATCGRSTSIP